ncbi:MAG TPA: hypothetical protein VLM85_23280 [Polyangiaceae bacterium]|nr:hypothetical protein [Polyangiaceae bacterium]
MLPFHKRARVNSSIEILSEELEPIELPPVRPPSVRPPSVRPPSFRAPITSASFGDEEMTVVRMDKRASSFPPPRSDLRMPHIPRSLAPRFDDDAPTEMHPSSRPLLSMSTSSQRQYDVDDLPSSSSHWAPPPPPSSLRVEEPPRSVAAVDPNASAGRQVDLSMTSSLSGTTDLRKLRRPTMAWAAGLVAVGVFAGLVAAFVARGEGLAAAAALVDPSQHATADVAKAAAAAQAPEVVAAAVARPGAAAQQAVQPVQAAPVQPAHAAQAPSCAADTAAAPQAAPAQPAQVAPTTVDAPKVIVAKPVEARVEAKVVAAAPRPVVHHVEAPAPRGERAEVAERAPAPPPAVHRSSRHGKDDMESASAADALAKAQLDAALSR